MFWKFLLFVLIIIIVVFIVAYRCRIPILTDVVHYFGGDEMKICDKTAKYIDQFINGQITRETALGMESLASDIAYQTDDVGPLENIRSAAQRDLAASKLALDTMLHWFIYNKAPNSISAAAIRENVRKLTAGPTCFNEQALASMCKLSEAALRKKSDDSVSEQKLQVSRDHFRTSKIIAYGPTQEEINALREELSRARLELRESKTELERKTSNLGSSIALDECRSDRRRLQEQLYEHRREIDRLRLDNVTTGEIPALRAKIESLRQQNTHLEAAISRAPVNDAELLSLRTQLHECKKVLDSVLNAQ